MIIFNENKLRNYKIRIDGADDKGKNTSRQFSVLAHSIQEVYDCLTEAAMERQEHGQQKA